MSNETNKRGDYRGMSEASKANLPNGWGNNADVLEKHKWKKGQSGNPNGRPRNRVKELMEGLLSKKQVLENTNLEQKDVSR